MKILKENATREEAIIHAAKHLGEKVANHEWGGWCWFHEDGVMFMGDTCNSHTFIRADGYTLWNPTPEPDPAEIPEEVLKEMFEAWDNEPRGGLAVGAAIRVYHRWAAKRGAK